MHMLFRDHTISDLIGFVYSGMPPADAARHLIGNIREAAKPVLAKGRDAVVSIILDGENAWEYYPKSGREFLRRFYDGLQHEPGVEAVTISEAIARHRDFGKLTSIVPGSWINANFNVWIGAPEDNRAGSVRKQDDVLLVLASLFLLILLLSVLYVFPRRREFVFACVLAIPTMGGRWFLTFNESEILLYFEVLCWIGFLGVTVVVILRQVLSATRVSNDTISGAVCGYLLFGIMFAFLYALIELLFPGSFIIDRKLLHAHLEL